MSYPIPTVSDLMCVMYSWPPRLKASKGRGLFPSGVPYVPLTNCVRLASSSPQYLRHSIFIQRQSVCLGVVIDVVAPRVQGVSARQNRRSSRGTVGFPEIHLDGRAHRREESRFRYRAYRDQVSQDRPPRRTRCAELNQEIHCLNLLSSFLGPASLQHIQ
jgi:hypothetical protein